MQLFKAGSAGGYSFASPPIVHKGTGGAGIGYTLLNAAGQTISTSPGMSSQPANTLRAVPFILAAAIRYDRIALANNAGGAGAAVRVGIYRNKDTDTMYPGEQITEDIISVVSGAAVNENTVAERTLSAGLYWLVWNCNGAHQIWSPGDFHNPLMPINAPLTATNQQGLQLAAAYAALPNPFTAGASYFDASIQNPIGVFVRRA